jgi:hypothetical protein
MSTSQKAGEQFGRRHYHYLLAGAREALANQSTCFWLMDKWEKLDGGMREFTCSIPH